MLEDSCLIAMRDEAYELARGFDLLLNDAKLQLDYRIAESAEEQWVKTQELAQAQHNIEWGCRSRRDSRISRRRCFGC